MSEISLSENETDGIGELMNVGVGKASAALGALLKVEIDLSVPRVYVVPLADVRLQTAVRGVEPVAGSYSNFSGPFRGAIGFIVPAAARSTFVRLILGTDFDDDAEVLERDLLLEIGNIVCSACLAGISNAFKFGFSTAPPIYVAMPPGEVLGAMTGSRPDCYVLLVELDFFIRQDSIQIFLWLAMDEPAIAHFRNYLGRYLAELGL